VTTPGGERRLAAILSADIAGYSRLIGADEEGTVRTLSAWREQVAALVREHRGRLADFTGDNFLAEFPTALDAVSCALETQRVLAARNVALPEDRRLQFRMGVHLGDVRVEGERLFGTGVNVAARLQTLAEPGGVCLSDAVRSEVATRLGLALEDLGPRELKNLPEPVHAFRVRATDETAKRGEPARPRRRLRLVLAAMLGSLLLLAAALYLSWPRPLGLVLDLAGIGRPLVNPPLPDKPSLVVLPFQNLSNDPDQEYFSDGISEDLTTDLSRMRSFFVISRSSAFTYKGKAVRVEDVGRELGVRYVIEGSVRKAGEQVRVTAQLIDAANGHHVWSERYDRELADIFALQTELVDDIMASLPSKLWEAEAQRVRRKPPGDVSAYDATLRGRAYLPTPTRAGNEQARGWFERALELDPSYADAAAALGLTYLVPYLSLWNLDCLSSIMLSEHNLSGAGARRRRRRQADTGHGAWSSAAPAPILLRVPVRTQSRDTSAEIERRQIEAWRAMSAAQKLAIVSQLTLAAEELARAGIRERHPKATEREIELRLGALRLDRDTMIRVFGWDPEKQGY
jgi:TolB-like protein/class 3 adenylate cyclase